MTKSNVNIVMTNVKIVILDKSISGLNLKVDFKNKQKLNNKGTKK